MRIVIATTILNAVLDLVFVAGFGMGVAGAAWATVIAQVLSLAAQPGRNHERKELIRFTKGNFAHQNGDAETDAESRIPSAVQMTIAGFPGSL